MQALKSLIFLSILFCSYSTVWGQAISLQEVHIRTDVVLQAEEEAGPAKAATDGSGISVHTLKFYISNVQLHNAKKTIYTENNSFHLIDFSDTSTCVLRFDKRLLKKAKYLQFNLGIDSITNVSGAMAGDLDPIKGMYWTWQSGYINLKLEGSFVSGTGGAKKFEYHLGGYSSPHASMQVIQVPLKKNAASTLMFNLKSLLPMLLSSGSTTVMSPGKPAQRISLLLSKCFTLE